MSKEDSFNLEEKKEKKIIIPEPITLEINLEGKKFFLKEYNIGRPPEGGVISPGLMETGELKEVEKLYREEPALVSRHLKEQYKVDVPYAFLLWQGGKIYGNYTTRKGQKEFEDADLVLTKESFMPPAWAKELWDFSAAIQRKKFSTDNEMACLRGLDIKKGKTVFQIGAGLYSQSFYSNGSEGTNIGLAHEKKVDLLKSITPQKLAELEGWSERLENKYGKNKALRQIIFSHYRHLPEFGEHTYNNSIGLAGMVLTEKDQQFIFVKRGKTVSVNLGINCTVSGAAEFNEAILSQYGLQYFLGKETSREAKEELGFKAGALLIGEMKKRIRLELGLSENDYDLTPVGFIRELSRGGKPECMFLIQYKGSAEDVVRSIIENPHSEKKEIESLVYAQPLNKTTSLSKTRNADSLIQHKALVNLMLINEYLKNNT